MDGTESESGADDLLLLPAAQVAWFLDVDGTLLELAPTPDRVHADERVSALLARLQVASGGAVALISGRSVAMVDSLFEPLRLPVAGQHGVERRDASGVIHHHRSSSEGLAAARRALIDWAAEHPEVLLEDKGLSLALHYRRAPAMEAQVRHFLGDLVTSGDGGLCLQPGKMVFEVKPSGRDKGMAIREFLDEAPFLGRRPVFVGDDASDEYGFEIVNRRGGVSIKVGEGATAATRCLPDVGAVRDLLTAVLGRAA